MLEVQVERAGAAIRLNADGSSNGGRCCRKICTVPEVGAK